MKRLVFLLPTGTLFASPWMHKLIYSNFLAAWPDMPHEGAHFLAFVGAVIVVFATFIVAGTTR